MGLESVKRMAERLRPDANINICFDCIGEDVLLTIIAKEIFDTYEEILLRERFDFSDTNGSYSRAISILSNEVGSTEEVRQSSSTMLSHLATTGF